jgi:hypothetical protein
MKYVQSWNRNAVRVVATSIWPNEAHHPVTRSLGDSSLILVSLNQPIPPG